VRFEIGGMAREGAAGIELGLELRNRGDTPATKVRVEGELAGEAASAESVEIAPGSAGALLLRFPEARPRPGIHVLPLLLEFHEGRPAPGAVPSSQRAFLSVAFGSVMPPAVRVRIGRETSLRDAADVEVDLESADGAAHRVELRLLTARGLVAPDLPEVVDVPALGQARGSLRVRRSGGARGVRHGALVVARTLDGPLERASAEPAVIRVEADPALMPVLGAPLLLAGALLLLLGAFLEARSLQRARDASGPGGPRAAGAAPSGC
jgi:hypothetical protein